MEVQKAKDHYLGKNGCVRLNCARSVAEPFKERLALTAELLEHFAAGIRQDDSAIGNAIDNR